MVVIIDVPKSSQTCWLPRLFPHPHLWLKTSSHPVLVVRWWPFWLGGGVSELTKKVDLKRPPTPCRFWCLSSDSEGLNCMVSVLNFCPKYPFESVIILSVFYKDFCPMGLLLVLWAPVKYKLLMYTCTNCSDSSFPGPVPEKNDLGRIWVSGAVLVATVRAGKSNEK